MGSSSISRSEPPNRMRVSSSRRRSPPESALTGSDEPVLREPESGRDRPHLRFGPVPARRAVLVLEPGESRDVAIRRVLLERHARLLEAGGQIDQVARFQQVGRARSCRRSPDAAGGPVAGSRSRRGAPRAPGRRVLARQHPQRAGLPGAVAPHHAHLVAGSQGEGQIAHHRHAARLDLEVVAPRAGSSDDLAPTGAISSRGGGCGADRRWDSSRTPRVRGGWWAHRQGAACGALSTKESR